MTTNLLYNIDMKQLQYICQNDLKTDHIGSYINTSIGRGKVSVMKDGTIIPRVKVTCMTCDHYVFVFLRDAITDGDYGNMYTYDGTYLGHVNDEVFVCRECRKTCNEYNDYFIGEK